jgi:nucleotide-binding universal stress UspA family protein
VLEEAHKNQARAEADQLFGAIRKLADAAGIALDPVLVESNDVWKQVIATAKKKKCDLICMASHGRRGISGVLLGSETHKVLTHSDLPVLVLR